MLVYELVTALRRERQIPKGSEDLLKGAQIAVLEHSLEQKYKNGDNIELP